MNSDQICPPPNGSFKKLHFHKILREKRTLPLIYLSSSKWCLVFIPTSYIKARILIINDKSTNNLYSWTWFYLFIWISFHINVWEPHHTLHLSLLLVPGAQTCPSIMTQLRLPEVPDIISQVILWYDDPVASHN